MAGKFAFLGLFAVLIVSCGTPPPMPMPEAVELDNEAPIINGRFSTEQEFPATGALLIRGVDNHKQRYAATCTGTLIAPDVVLTAAHCQEETAGNRARYFFSLASDVSNAGDTLRTMPQHTYGVRTTWPHPQYGFSDRDGLGRSNDVALAFLQKPVVDVAPARMLAPSETRYIRLNAAVSIVGYGRRSVPVDDDSDDDSEARETIRKSKAESVINEVGPYELQIGRGLPNPEKCYGDSGGPTYINTNLGQRLLGITSHVYDAAGFRKGTVDERVDAFYDWVNQTMLDACDNGARTSDMCR